MDFEPLARDLTYYEPLENPTPLEIADRLEERGYPTQAEKIRSGLPQLLAEAADWLRTEAGYVRGDAVELLGYSHSLRQAAELEDLL